MAKYRGFFHSGFFIIAVIGAALVLGFFQLQQKLLREQHSQNEGEAKIGTDFELTNQHGQIIHSRDFRGKIMLVYFGFTHCPDVCPTDLSNITQALYKLQDQAEKIVPVFITIDPERDDVEAMQRYAESFHPSLQALTGTPEQITKVAEGYRVFFQKVTPDTMSDYLMNHSAFTYVMDQEGKYLTHLPHAAPIEEIIATLQEQINASL